MARCFSPGIDDLDRPAWKSWILRGEDSARSGAAFLKNLGGKLGQSLAMPDEICIMNI